MDRSHRCKVTNIMILLPTFLNYHHDEITNITVAYDITLNGSLDMDNITWKILNLLNQNPCDKRILDRPLRKIETAKEKSCICKKAYDGHVQSYGGPLKMIAQFPKDSGKFDGELILEKFTAPSRKNILTKTTQNSSKAHFWLKARIALIMIINSSPTGTLKRSFSHIKE